MLRYFSLLCLLLFIQITFCYNYISDQPTSYKTVRKLRSGNLRQRKYMIEDGRRVLKRHGGYGDSVAQIDLASFIQKPDYDTVDENEPYIKKHRNAPQNEFGSPSQLPSENIFGKPARDFPNQDIDSQDFDSKYSKMTNHMSSTADQSTLHKPQKKCAMNHMKVPFFSHKSTSSPKPMKNKKRKPFCFGGKCKKTDNTANVPKTPESTNRPEETLKLKKRDNYERICPLCKRKMTDPNADFKTSNNLIHNSRQYYQHVGEMKEKTSQVTEEGEMLKEDTTNADISYMRKKRDSKTDSDKVRQLKELDEVRRKVDGVQIVTPRFQSQQQPQPQFLITPH